MHRYGPLTGLNLSGVLFFVSLIQGNLLVKIIFNSGDSLELDNDIELNGSNPLAVIRNVQGIRCSVHWSTIAEMLDSNRLRRLIVARKQKALRCASVELFGSDACLRHADDIYPTEVEMLANERRFLKDRET